MSSENMVRAGKLLINEQMSREIADFLLPLKRSALVDTLDEEGELSQGELALKIDSSAASLANIMVRFEQFKYPLLEVKIAGKYRLYSLSEIGKAYMRQIKERADQKDDSRPLESVDGELLRKAEASVHEFGRRQARQSESWQTRFDEAMMRRIYGMGDRLDEESEQWVDQYLECLERLTLQESEGTLDKAMKLLQNPILKDRVGKYMDRFAHFLPVLEGLRNRKRSFKLLKGLEAVFTGKDKETCTELLKASGLKELECDKLWDTAVSLKKCVAWCSEEEIHQYFDSLLPDCGVLSYSIARWISDKDS